MTLAQVKDIPVPGNFSNFAFGGNPDTFYSLDFLGKVVSKVILYSIVVAGLLFFIKLIVSGYGYLTSAGEPAKIASASKNLMNAATGLLVVFATFFIAQIIQVIFGIKIL